MKGYSRDEIARATDIGAGTVNVIIQQSRKEDADFDLLGGVAVELRRGDRRVADFASLFRLKNLIEDKEVELGLAKNNDKFTEYKKFEAIIVMLDVFCFKHEFPLNRFFEIVLDIYSQANSLDISIAGIPGYIENQKQEILRLQSEMEGVVEWQGTTLNLLKEYQKNMPHLRSTVNSPEQVQKERDLYQSELDYVKKQYQQQVWAQKVSECERFTDPKEVKKAEIEFGNEINGDRYISRLRDSMLKRILLDLSW